MVNLTAGQSEGKKFISHAPGYWPDVPAELWNDWKWQLKNRVTTLAQLEQHLNLCEEERAGVLLSGDKLALAVTPHFFNLIPRDNPNDPIRRQVIPRMEESLTTPFDMADPCGEDHRSDRYKPITEGYDVDDCDDDDGANWWKGGAV